MNAVMHLLELALLIALSGGVVTYIILRVMGPK